MVMCCDVLN